MWWDKKFSLRSCVAHPCINDTHPWGGINLSKHMPGITCGKHIPQNKWITTHVQTKAFVIVTPNRKKEGAQFQLVSSAFHFHFSIFLNNTCVCIYIKIQRIVAKYCEAIFPGFLKMPFVRQRVFLKVFSPTPE